MRQGRPILVVQAGKGLGGTAWNTPKGVCPRTVWVRTATYMQTLQGFAPSMICKCARSSWAPSLLPDESRHLCSVVSTLGIRVHDGPGCAHGEAFHVAAQAGDVVPTTYELAHLDQADLYQLA